MVVRVLPRGHPRTMERRRAVGTEPVQVLALALVHPRFTIRRRLRP
jgi:hypothetical protein